MTVNFVRAQFNISLCLSMNKTYLNGGSWQTFCQRLQCRPRIHPDYTKAAVIHWAELMRQTMKGWEVNRQGDRSPGQEGPDQSCSIGHNLDHHKYQVIDGETEPTVRIPDTADTTQRGRAT